MTMLLLASLLASAALILPQDDAAAAPSGTSETVRAFLMEAESNLYDPADDGLQSLSFVVPFGFPRDQLDEMLASQGQKLPEGSPETIRLGESVVTWSADAPTDPVVEGTLSDDFPAPLAPMRPQIQGTLIPMGHQTLAVALSKTVSFGPLLESFDARFDGAEGDNLRVVFTRKPDAPAGGMPTDTITWLFNQDDNLPAGTLLSFTQDGPMGAMEITIDTRYEWKPSRGEGSPLVLAAVDADNQMGTFATQTQRTVYRHQELQGVVVLTGYQETMSQTTPMGSPPPVTKDVGLEGLTVNSGAGADEADSEG